jgi:uncharacterized coiled-coil protein SlyX
MLDKSNEPTDLTMPVDESAGVVSNDGKKAAAVKAFKALRAHDNVGIERNLDAAAAIASLKASLPRGEFGRFCTDELHISSTYRARLLRLDDLKDYVPEAWTWAAAHNHRLAECRSVQNLIKIVEHWRSKGKPPEPKPDANKQKGRRGKDIAELERVVQQTTALAMEREKTISGLKSKVANQDDTIGDLRKRLADCEEDIVKLRDHLPSETRDRALVALTSSRESELAAIAKRHHWHLNDLRRELQN